MTPEKQIPPAEAAIVKFSWRRLYSFADPIEKTTTWTLTGLAAILGFVLSNLDKVMPVVGKFGALWFIVFTAVSLLLAAASRVLGMALSQQAKSIDETAAMVNSPNARAAFAQVTMTREDLAKEIAAPLWWPYGLFIRKSFLKGTTDPLMPYRVLVRIFCAQVYLNCAHWLTALAAFLALAFNVAEPATAIPQPQAAENSVNSLPKPAEQRTTEAGPKPASQPAP